MKQQNGKWVTIGSIGFVALAIAATVGLSTARTQTFVTSGEVVNTDSVVTMYVKDSSFVEDTMLLLQKKQGNDTAFALAKLSYGAEASMDSTVFSQDTLMNMRVFRNN